MSPASTSGRGALTAPFHAAALLAAGALKLHYSRAGADDLVWILGPTAWVTELLSGIHFERELRVGFISHSHRMILEPACAGVNFMIAVLLMLACGFVHRLARPSMGGVWLAGSLTAAYLLTVLTNASRIIAAIQLRGLDIYGGAVTPGRVHRLIGVVVYCLSLMGVWTIADRLFDRAGARGGLDPLRALAPLAWYVGIAVGAPILNRAWLHDPERFAEHALTILSICLLIASVLFLARISRGNAAQAR